MGDSKCSPNRDPRLRSSSTTTWDNQVSQNNQFNTQVQPVHTAYQHLHQNNMYNNPNQYANQQYYPGYDNYNYNAYQYNQAGQGYMNANNQNATENYTGTGGWTSAYNQAAPAPPSGSNFNYPPEKTNKSDGVAQELVKQKENLLKERETYKDRVVDLGKKLKMLVEQKDHLTSKRSPDRDTLYIIEENTKLQQEIQNKIKDATNVIEILSGSIGDGCKTLENDGLIKDLKNDKVKVNYKHYDPEIHWCRMCDVFPQSARKLLIHLHSKGHQEIVQEESPWHKLSPEPKFPVYDGAPIRRLPIKGLQFFVASTAWYCRLCDIWIGDLHCASEHLMSITHTQNYSNFVEQNPHWEIEWLKDREKALERIKRKEKQDSDSDDKKRRRKKDKYSSSFKDKKKKKRSKRRRKHSSDSSSSSSSSSSSGDEEDDDKSKSIHVAMRNKIKMFSNSDDKLEMLDKLLQDEKQRQVVVTTPNVVPEDKLMSQWMTVSEPPDKDKKLLESLKEKLKQKQDAEKAKATAEYEAMKRAKEKEEFDKKQAEKAKAEAKHREEEETKKRDKMSLKLKEQSTKVKSGKRSYRSHSRSPSRDKSPTPEKKYNRRNSHRRSYEDSHRYDDKDKKNNYKKFGFIGKMPLFKNQRVKKPESDRIEKEIQREDYDVPRKTRFQPGNLARAFIPEPEVVLFPKLSCYPPLAPPPPPAITTEIPPAPPNISVPAPPPPPKIEQAITVPEVVESAPIVDDTKEELVEQQEEEEESKDDYEMLYEEYGSTSDYNQLYQHQPPHTYDYMQVPNDTDPDNIPRSHTMPLQPPPLPPDDPSDLAMLGISSDDMAVQQMY